MSTIALGVGLSSGERRFYVGMTAAILGAVFLGFARTFFLRPLFPEAALNSPAEPFFYVHGAFFAAWFLLLVIQPCLVMARRIDVHRRLGQLGGGLAAVMVVLGVLGALIAAQRPTGFVQVPVPPLQFLAVPLTDMALFSIFVTLGFIYRRKVQNHKRYMLLASLSILDAAIARWPFEVVRATLPVPLTVDGIFVALFLVPMILWDLASRRRIHPVTLWGGLVLIAVQPLRLLIIDTAPWLAFAGWATSWLG